MYNTEATKERESFDNLKMEDFNKKSTLKQNLKTTYSHATGHKCDKKV
jgi:hypothetical protein